MKIRCCQMPPFQLSNLLYILGYVSSTQATQNSTYQLANKTVTMFHFNSTNSWGYIRPLLWQEWDNTFVDFVHHTCYTRSWVY